MAKYKWDIAAFEELRRSPEVERMLADVVQMILDEVGNAEGYDGAVTTGRTRSRGSVVVFGADALADNADNHTLLRALGRVYID